ncbi:hypothetical protein QR680_014895 [Steinernema hermaphroditum]|uniref:Protein kinase domain-containing protein n=1 Tax=Steinernema hermaphroditum TaxID=289476 RepID=A0AA39ID26_9BILA|nr:hypothetical protein QR680_014889 [Steinernema hermaphroditum]KAK0420799.1 hypothetical protein QR680_014895 [Steinernema hermaphroditum]
MDQILSRGRFGAVYRASFSGRPFAVKVVSKRTEDEKEEFGREFEVLEILARCDHPHLVPYHGASVPRENKDLGLLFFNLLPLGSLQDFVEYCNGPFHIEDGLCIYHQLLDGLAYLHSLGIFHRDIKPANIMMLTELHVQIADFGLAHYDEGRSLQVFFDDPTGSPGFLPPELYESGRFHGIYGDLWAAAVTLLEICTEQNLWEIASKEDEGFQRHLKKEYTEKDKRFWAVFEEHEELVKSILEPDYLKRHTPQEYKSALMKYRTVGFL